MEIARAVVLATKCSSSSLWASLGLSAAQLAPIANKPILFHHLETLRRAGVHTAALVTDDATQWPIRRAVGDGSSFGLDLVHMSARGNDPVLESAELAAFVGRSAVLVHHGDELLREPLGKLRDHFATSALDALVLRPRPAVEGGDGTGYIIGEDIHPRLRRRASRAGAVNMGEVLAALRASGARIQERGVDACQSCRGGTTALLEGNRRMLDELTLEPYGERILRSEIQGRVSIHPSAEIVDSVVRGPVSIGPRVTVSNAYVGPYTSIAGDAYIDTVEIENSVVLDGAEIRFLATRVDGSVVGPRAKLMRDFRVKQGLRLSVGEAAQVMLS